MRRIMPRAACAALVCGLASMTSPVLAETIIFLVDHEITGGAPATVRVTLDDASDPGCIRITAEVVDPLADLRGIFFHVADESLLPTLSVAGDDVAGWEFQANSVDNLGGGANLIGGVGNMGPFDVGVQIGTPGIGKDDVASTSLTLCSSSPIDLSLLADQYFGVRLTSVGLAGDRGDSSKLQTQAPPVPEPATAALLLGTLGSTLIVAGRPRQPR